MVLVEITAAGLLYFSLSFSSAAETVTVAHAVAITAAANPFLTADSKVKLWVGCFYFILQNSIFLSDCANV